jgi:hypothetical protein
MQGMRQQSQQGGYRPIHSLEMHNAHIDISKGLEEGHVVFVCFDLREDEIAAAARAVEATKAERYRTPRIEADDVVGMRELTALADELDHALPTPEPDSALPTEEPAGGSPAVEPDEGVAPGADQAFAKMVFRPARVSVLRDAVAAFVESRDETEFVSHEDREALALLRPMLAPLEQLCADAMRAALSPESHAH